MTKNQDLPNSPFLVERLMREARRRMEDQEVTSEEDLEAAIGRTA